jgi:hemolysin activation/secretion protein
MELAMRMYCKQHLLNSAALISAALSATVVQAQTVPNTARPSTIERQNRIMEERPDVGGAPVVRDEVKKRAVDKSGASFELKGIKLEGVTALDETEISAMYQTKIGSNVVLGELNQIADDITALYRNRGYILTRAVVPPQRAEDGIFTIRIVEGFVNSVQLVGDVESGNEGLLRAYADKIIEVKPLNVEMLERYLLLMEDLPGVEARAVLQPAKDVSGASDIIVTITRRSFEASVSADNRGSRYLGPAQASVSGFFNNLLGLDELTQVRVSNSILNRSELFFGEVRHTEQVGTEGTSVILAANKVSTQPGSVIKDLDIRGESGAISVGISHPVIRSRRTNWYVSGDFTMRNVEVDTLGSSLYKDKTRVLNIGTAYDFVDSFSAINKAELNVAKGLNWGTGQGLNVRSRANGETDFERANAKVSRIQPLWSNFSLFAAANGQHSTSPQLASEEFTLGGAEFGSAYDSAEISGDSGVAVRAELQYSEAMDQRVLKQYQLYTFYDIGKVWNRNPIAGSEQSSESLSSAGVGARFNLMESLTGGIEGAVPMTRDVAALNNSGDNPRVFFNLQYRY